MLLTLSRTTSLARARERLCELEEDVPTIHELAAESGISTALFIRQFSAVFGETPHQLRIRHRVGHAKDLLVRGRSVTETCFELGFSSMGTFSAMFRKRVGVPPSAFARRFQIAVPSTLPPAPHGCFCLMAAALASVSPVQL